MALLDVAAPTPRPPAPHVPHPLVSVAPQPEPAPELTVAVVGLGYVGLPTALSLASAGIGVLGLDVSDSRIDAIARRAVDLSPADLARLDVALTNEWLVTTTAAPSLAGVDDIIICVPTPIDEHATPDLAALTSACRTVVEHARAGHRIVLTSTTYVGCTRELLVEPLAERGLVVGEDVHVAFSPERINPGVATTSPEQTPRVLGGATPECATECAAFLRPTCASLHVVSSMEVAEMTKLLENTFRAVNIAFANEMADVAAMEGISITEVIQAAATKPYGFMPFTPGAGVGGHCIPCDPHYLLWRGRARRHHSPLVESAMTAIARRPRQVVGRARTLLADAGLPLAGSRVHVWGLAYKPGVADVRESPALEIIAELAAHGATVTASDPVTGAAIPGLAAVLTDPDAAAEADLVVVVTVHAVDDLVPLARAVRVLDTTYSLSDTIPQAQEL